MAVAEALTDEKCEQGSVDKVGALGAGGGNMPSASEEYAPGFVLSSAARRQGPKPIRAALVSTAPRALPSRPPYSRVVRGSEGVSLICTIAERC